MADIVAVCIVLLCVYIGYKRGFVKSVSKICCWIISIIIAKLLHPYVTAFVKESFVGDYVKAKITESIGKELPVFLRQATEYTADSITEVVVGIISILLIILATYIVANVIIATLGILAKAPVISDIDGFLGAVCGLAIGVLIVHLVLAVMVLFDVGGVYSWIENSIAVYYIYRHNILLDLIF